MSFREKSAWIMLIMIVLMTSLWTAHMPWWRPFALAPDPNPIVFHALILATVGFVVIVVVAHIVIAVLAPRDANARADERERLIGLKATRIGAYVYAGLSLSSILIIHLGANEIGLAYFLLYSFAIAEAVNYAARVVYYRRGVGP